MADYRENFEYDEAVQQLLDKQRCVVAIPESANS